ncbi:MAG: glycosyltransferase [Bacteroidales bacterium]
MKISIISPFFPYRGGIAEFSNRLFETLIEQNVEVQAINFKRMYPTFLFPGKTQYVETGSTHSSTKSLQLLDSINPLSYIRTYRAIQRYAPDVVIFTYWMTFFIPAYLIIILLLRRKKVKVLVLFHNFISHEPHFFDKVLLRIFSKNIDGGIALSQSVEQDFREVSPQKPIKFSVHPLYDHFGEKLEKQSARKKLKLSESKKTLLFFGLIRDYKGLDWLLEAFSQLSNDYQLLIAGEPYGEFDKYSQQIAALPNAKNVFCYTRYVANEEVPDFFSASDVCILPYKSATQSGITSISYHFDVPIIATNVGGLHESVLHRKTGLIVAPNPKAIHEGIIDFFNEDSSKFINGIRDFKQELSWSEFAKNIVAFSKTLQ